MSEQWESLSSSEPAGLGSVHLAFARNLFPDLARSLDRALEQSGSSEGAARDAAFETLLGAEVVGFRGRHAELAWHEVADEAARDAVLTAFIRARKVLDGTQITLPAPESFAELIDVESFAQQFIEGYAVVPAPYGLGLAGWRDLFQRAAQKQPELLSDAEPLIVATEAEREFTLLDTPPTGVPRVQADEQSVSWTLRLIPAGPAPALLGLNFEHGPHLTLPEMLMLQLMIITAGEAPIDQASFSWIAGGLADGKLATRHVYDSADRAVRLSCREIGNQGPHLGARTPITLQAK